MFLRLEKLVNLTQNRKAVIIFFTVLFLIIIAISFLGSKCGSGEKLIKIEKGWGSDEIGQKLKDEELVSSKWIFVFYAWVKGYNTHLQAGEYLLNSEMSVFKIARMIANGEISENYAKVTIPEGWTNKKIEERLIALGILKQGDRLPEKKEGYLFPDTYYFKKNSSIDIVVKKMSDNFMKKVGEGISMDLLADSSMKLPNAIIMASIIEKEVVSDEDRAIVSGIFWKRIENDIPLQSCATIAYILGKEKKQYSYDDTRVKSPYNTYTNLGLPPAPINNPGLSAIKAAFYPKETDYYFFLSASDGTTIYAETIEEHNQNKAKYLN
jgi:UPF0755 protein